MKRMLFNATQQEELRVAIVDGQKLIDIDIETTGREQRKSNIYQGVITRIEPSLEACFVSYGEERHGFLPFKEVARTYFREGSDARSASIKEALREGQEIMVQVEKEERGNKGAALTSFVSLAGRYLVLMPNNPRGGGVSRRVEGEERQELRETMDRLDLPAGMSVIARTAGIGRNVDELQWDLNYLMQLWRAIEGAGSSASGAFLIYQESSLVIRAIRDYFQPDIGEILIDTDDIHEQAQQFMSHVMPDMVHRVKRYQDDVALFSRFQIEHQIETAYSRTVPLPSGGAIVIDHTEALVSVDVNSARATRGSDIEATAFNTNCEAAEEVARQLRLRDLGGLIVIDFIDMENAKNQREVETRLKDALHYDRARVQMGKISRFGLMELSRQRLRPSLSEGSHVTCPRCNGTGHIRDTESSALQVLRIIQEEAMKEHSAAIHIQAPVDVAAYLLNEKRGEILKIETRHRVGIIMIPNKYLETPHYKLERIKSDDPRLEEVQASYLMAEEAEIDIGYGKRQKGEVKPRQEAVVKSITPDQPAPVVDRSVATPVVQSPIVATGAVEEGFFAKILTFLGMRPAAPVTSVPTPVMPSPISSPDTPITPRERSDRTTRNPRGRSRGGRSVRDRDESAAAATSTVGEPMPTRTPRPPREPKEVKEPREPREMREPIKAREQREIGETSEIKEAREPSEGKRARPPRTPREERKPVQTADHLQPLLGSSTDNVEIPTVFSIVNSNVNDTVTSSVSASDSGFDDLKAVEISTVSVAENRAAIVSNADDSDSNNNDDGTDSTDSANIGDANAEGAAQTEEQRRRRRRRGGRNRSRREPISGDMQETGGESERTVPLAADVGSPLSNAMALPLVPQEVAPIEAQTPASFQPAPLEDSTPANLGFDTPAMTFAQPLEAVEVEPAEAVEEVEAVEAVEAVELAKPADTKMTTDEGAQGSELASVQTAAPMPVQEPSAMALEDIQGVLDAAGLTQAATDPEKLRLAQAATDNAASAPRLGREPRQLHLSATEPLVQIETR